MLRYSFELTKRRNNFSIRYALESWKISSDFPSYEIFETFRHSFHQSFNLNLANFITSSQKIRGEGGKDRKVRNVSRERAKRAYFTSCLQETGNLTRKTQRQASVKTRRASQPLFTVAFHDGQRFPKMARHRGRARFMSRRAAHLISHEKLHVSAQLCPRCRSVASTSHTTRNVHSFIHNALFSNQPPPDAIRSGHFRNDHAPPIRHIGANLKADRSSIPFPLPFRFTFLPSISFLVSRITRRGSRKTRPPVKDISRSECRRTIDNYDESIRSYLFPI